MRVSCARKSTLSTRNVKRDNMKIQVGITRYAIGHCKKWCFRSSKGVFVGEVDTLFSRGDAMRHYRAAHLRRAGSRRRKGSGRVGIARRWGSYAAHCQAPPRSTVRYPSLRPLSFPRTSSYMSSHKALSRPFAASGSASLDRSFQ